MRKQISYVDLKSELEDILKNMFSPNNRIIKDQIEWLIKHEFLKRDCDDMNMLAYIA